ncbi:hypothetical protein BGZ99_005649 [Dissophora globulifera]|uniref:SCD domain-containing protein n=1 Tax=Dissophora globulifera TaxID=979702 RepID=A0A9P6RTB8_9FUNG|nr:hypothetical protein BGZ99_005649 [Dissophora globulifera]
MTRPEAKTTSGTRAEPATRRSARTSKVVQPVEPKPAPTKVKSAAPTKAKSAPKGSIRAPKSKEDVVESGEDEVESGEDVVESGKDDTENSAVESGEDEEEEVLVRAPRRTARTQKASEARPTVTRATPARNGAKATQSTRSTKTTKPVKVAAPVQEEEEQDDEIDEDEEEEEEEEEEEVSDEDDEESSSSEEEDADDSDFEEPSQKRKVKTATPKKPRQPKLDRIPVIRPRKPRQPSSKSAKAPKAPKEKTTSVRSKTSTFTAARRSASFKLIAGADEEDEGDEEQSELYSAVLDSQAALDTVVADWISLYEHSSDEAMLNVINLLIRSCGCKQLISAEDFSRRGQKIVKVLDPILLRYKENTTNFDYPIVSKAKEFKKFKKNLLEFYTRLIHNVQDTILYDGKLVKTLLEWTFALSSSIFRPIRHTATAVALNIVSSLAEMASGLQDELDVTTRQLATSQKQKAMQSKIKQLEKKVATAQSHKADLLAWKDLIFESVFILRCRDVDPLVRLDCVHELGQWMAIYPNHYVASSYLRYLGWAISDKSAAVRLEALKVLAKQYEVEHHSMALRQFTNRFTERFIEMALGESDTFARLGAIRVVTLIHKHGQLEEGEIVKISTLIFGANAKVRKSLAKFVKARVWEDEVTGRMANCELVVQNESGADPIRKDWVELKSLVCFLIKVGKTEAEQNASKVVEDENTTGAGARLFEETKVGRISLAVEALWSEIEALKNWKSIADYLLVDHTTASTPSSSNAKVATLQDAYHLEEEEENVLLEIFIASLQLTLQPPAVPGFQKEKAKQKAEQDDVTDEVGRFCINIMPQLFVKYSVDAGRIRSVLVIPQLVPLSTYVDQRMPAAYEALVDDVIKVFKKHRDPSVLSAAALTLRTMQSYEILRSSHEGKIEALGATIVDTFLALISQTRDIDAADRITLDEFTICLRRLEHLIKCTDVTIKRLRARTQDPFEGLLEVINKYKTVHGQETAVVTSALSTSFLWMSWLCRAQASNHGADADWAEGEVQELLRVQAALVEVVSNLATKDTADIDQRVRRRAFQILGDIYWLFGGDMFHVSKGANRHKLHMTCPETTQDECEEFLRTELDLWDDKVQEMMKEIREARTPKAPADADMTVNEADSDANEDRAKEDTIDEAEIAEDETLAATCIEREDKYEMFGTVFSFMRQIMLRDFSMGHATAVIARYGRFGAEYDEGVKRVVNSIKTVATEGLTRNRKAALFMEVCLDSLEESYELHMGLNQKSANHALQLARLLTTAIKPPGFMQVRSGIDMRLAWDLHRRGIIHILEKAAGYQRLEHDINKAKIIKFFDVLVNMPFGPLTTTAEITNLQELIMSECERLELDVDPEDDTWEALRSYQIKLEKLRQKAVADQAAATKKAEESARLRVEQQDRAAEAIVGARDIDMEAAHGGDEVDDLSKPTERSNGKKRQAEDDDGDENEDEENEEVTRARRVSRSASAGASEDGEQSDDGDLAVKETKRIRVR